MAKSTPDLFLTSAPMTSEDSGSVISSPASEAGPTPCVSPASQKPVKSGRVHARVSRFRSLEKDKDMPTSDTSGPLFTTSSPSAGLQRSLENRLRMILDVNGSPEFALTWRQQDMPSGLPICQLAASVRRNGAIAISGWPTVKASDGGANSKRQERGAGGADLEETARSSWPTPMAGSPGTEDYNPAGNTDSSRKTVALVTPWTTPQSHDAQGLGSAERLQRHGTKHGTKNLQDEAHLIGPLDQWETTAATPKDATTPAESPPSVVEEVAALGPTTSATGTLAAWATPKERDWRSESATPETLAKIAAHPRGKDLNKMAAWATPRAEDAESSGMRHSRGIADTLTAQASLSSAPMENTAACRPTKPASLNPYFSLWLMGYPIGWAVCAGRVMRSTRSLRKPSSKQQKAP